MKALFFDIDGTLVNSQGIMQDSTKHALCRLQKNGHKIVLCSGRSLGQIYTWLKEMGFDGIVGASGAYVECGAQVVYEHHMEKETLIAVQTLLEQVNACYSAQTKEKVIMDKRNKNRMLSSFLTMGMPAEVADSIVKDIQIDEQLEQRSDIEKIVFLEADVPVDRIREQLSACCDVTEMSFKRPDDNSGEISSRGINKTLGMQKYIEYAGIAKEDTIAFGDGANDFDMIEYAQVGVAMGNAIADLKSRADFVTKGIDEGGIEYALKALGLL
ncbi:MAG: Cof-type HAD-IIB family hydrolase [Eubacterium sp.]|nr:Cof-type HAD-IIB family hydrolase [Eubacterium sp.]